LDIRKFVFKQRERERETVKKAKPKGIIVVILNRIIQGVK
jgi:hypothetical protein